MESLKMLRVATKQLLLQGALNAKIWLHKKAIEYLE
jgi:hypothetical protein